MLDWWTLEAEIIDRMLKRGLKPRCGRATTLPGAGEFTDVPSERRSGLDTDNLGTGRRKVPAVSTD